MSLLVPDLVQVPCNGLARTRRPCLVEPDLGSYRPSSIFNLLTPNKPAP